MDSRNRPRVFLVCVALALLTLVAFWSVLHHDFIGYDDQDYVTSNAHVQEGLSWSNVGWAFRSGFAGNWHPLTWLSHMADVSVFGLNPAGHHATNLFFHVANAVLLFLFLRRLSGETWPGAFVAGLFALHPLHVESVAWVAERKDVLSTFFFILTLWAYAMFAEARKPGLPSKSPKLDADAGNARGAWFYYRLALILLALGLMSKPMLVTVPFVLLLLDFWPLQRLQLPPPAPWSKSLLPLLVEKVPFLGLAIVASLVTIAVQSHGGTMSSVRDLGLSARITNAIVSYLGYLGKTLCPVDLAVFYPHPALTPTSTGLWPGWQVAAGAAVLFLVSMLAWRRRSQQPWLLVGWLWFLGTLVPVIGLVQVGSQAMADRYTYTPLIGVFLALAWTVRALTSRIVNQPMVCGFVGGLALSACLCLTRSQVNYWKNDFTLFEHALEVNEKNAPAHTVLASAFGRQAKYGFALVHAKAAVSADAHFAGAWHVFGDVADALGQPAEAVSHYQEALRLNPEMAATWCRLGFVYSRMGKTSEARQSYEKALETDPGFVVAHNNLAALLWSLGERDRALGEFRQAVRLSPNAADKRRNLATALAEIGNKSGAVVQLQEALKLKPDYLEATLDLGSLLVNQGRPAEAQVCFENALRLSPTNTQAHASLGLLLAQAGKWPEATTHFAEGVRLEPDAAAHYNLALALAMQGQFKEAIPHFRDTLVLSPQSAAAMNDLAWILATARQAELRDGPAAVVLAERACELTTGGNPRFLATLDAAYAEAGRFPEAIQMAEKARNLAFAKNEKSVGEAAETRLALYRKKLPFRQ